MKKSNEKSRRLTKEDLRILRQLEDLEARPDEEAWEILVPQHALPPQWPLAEASRQVNKTILTRILGAFQSDKTDESQAA